LKGITASKPDSQTLDDAVRQQTGPHLKTAAARAACHIVPDKEPHPGSSWKWYTFNATSGPLLCKYKTNDIIDLPCDPWEEDDTEVSFFIVPVNQERIFFGCNWDRNSRHGM
jgi:hypothetical protein